MSSWLTLDPARHRILLHAHIAQGPNAWRFDFATFGHVSVYVLRNGTMGPAGGRRTFGPVLRQSPLTDRFRREDRTCQAFSA
jgi:hypothetical protein